MPDLYLTLKYVHVLGAAVLFGTGIGIAFFQFWGNRRNSAAEIAPVLRLVVTADYVFTAPAAVLQPVTGASLAVVAGHSLLEGWILISIALYVVIGCCWIPVVFIQGRMRDLAIAAAADGSPLPGEYHRLMRVWFWLGWPAFLSILVIFWLMLTRPALF